jgi:ABC-type phosphate transport system substrate-binding protein
MQSIRPVVLAALAAVLSIELWAGDVKVIANPSIGTETITAADLKGVFLATKTSLDNGAHVEPVLAKDGPAHDVFIKEYLGKTDAALQTYYRSLVFTGKGSLPKTLSGEAEVVSYVSRTKGAIGYVSAGVGTTGVKTLAVK